MREKQLLQDPGYVDTVDTCCMLHAMRKGANSFHYVCRHCQYDRITM